MAHGSTIFEDDSLLSRADRALFRLETVLALIGGLAIFTLMIMAVISITGRNLFQTPLSGYVDLIEQTMPIIAYGALAYCHRLGGHVRMDFIINFLSPRLIWGLEALLCLLVMVLVAALVWGSYAHFARSFDFAAPLWSRDSSLDIALPLWPMKLVIPVIFSLFFVRLALQFWAYLRACLTLPEHPIAVPLPETAADVAAREAAIVKET